MFQLAFFYIFKIWKLKALYCVYFVNNLIMKGDDPVFRFTIKYCYYYFNQLKIKKNKINKFFRVLSIIKKKNSFDKGTLSLKSINQKILKRKLDKEFKNKN